MMYQNSKTPFSLTYVKAVFLFLFASLVFTTCKQQGPGSGVTTIDPEFTSYIYAYTSGIISKTEPILIRFVDPVITEDEIGTLAEDGLITFSPSIKGTAIWEDTRTLKFEQEDYLNSGTNYLGKVKVNKLFEDVPSKLNQFNFDFRTREMFYTVDFEGLRTADIGDLKNQSYKGIIKTTDYADPEKVENILSANQKGNKNLNILWEHGPDQLIHRFTVENIKRGDAVSSLKLNWNGNTLGVKKKGDTDIEIPMLGDFKVTDVKVMQSEEPFILINFSDPLRQNQNLNGLIRIKSYNSDIRFNIDGNQVRMYPSRRVNGEREILFSNGIVNIENYKMKDPGNWKVNFESQKPQLRLVGKGVILPNSKGLVFPFEAVSLNAVDVEIFKIYENNILQFLQYNELSSNYELERVGKVILQKKINLSDLDPEANAHNWTRYAFDLSDLVEKDPQAIYQVRIGFKKSYATFTCEENEASDFFASIEQQEGNNLDEYGDIKSIWDESYRYWSYTNYRWNHRENPCYPPYYRPHNFVRRNVVASDLGIVAKRGDDGTIFAAVSNLTSTAMMPGTTIELYNFQQQLIDKVTTDGKGMASIKLKKKPSFLIAKKDDQRGYLKLDDGSSLSLSRFDVAGSRAQKGLKGYIYADRGVWRPGDSIYINFILEDKTAKLPPNHPVTFEFYDPKGQLQEKMTTSKHVNKVYSFYTATDRESPTGNWYAKVKIGGATFEKTFKIETVKPNRLKIKIDFGKEELAADDQSINGDLQVNWLHGAPGKNLKAQVDIQLKTTPTKFNKYSDFVFDDPARRFSTEPFTIFDGQVNDKGSATVKGDLATNTFPPGKLAVNFRTRAFEKGGDFSSDAFTMPYSPYQNYVGLFIKKDKWGSKRLNLDKDNEVEIVVVDKDGNPVANKNLNMGLYRIQWRWWWERSQDRITNFNSATHTGAVETEKATTNSKGEATWNFTPERWGRYMIRICDETSGHCTGDMFYAGYPWYDDEDSGSRDGASMLVFNSDKKAYDVGETVELNIPTSGAGRALISIENGSKVVESYWTDVSKGETKFRFYATEEMTPTVYANVTLIQPHAQNQNDLPIRMYGVIPIKVEDPATKLQPEIKMADVLRPEEKVTIEVKESSGKPMAYTIAMVDEGLLDLTRFRTPDPWNKFYAREALGVKTWDVYDQVLGAYGGELERILSIGGDEAVNPEGPKKANRFKPVVHHIGPFFLEKGKKAKHELMMPNYVGSVRTMVVAADKGAYGNAEKTTPVKKPLMVLATLPRVLGPGETVRLPVNVFAMEDKVKNVKVSVETSPLLELIGPSTKNIQFNTVGDQIVNFEYRVKEGIGLAEVKITATGAGETATQEIELDVRNPNPHVTEVINKVLEPGSTWDTNIRPVGMAGTNSGILEVSNVPPINLGERLNWLIRYPHGCIEQTTSSGFPQLFVNKLIEIEDNKKKEIENNIIATIERLRKFQISSGGFAYWTGGTEASEWGTNYGGHFMLEAQAMGYSLPVGMLERWKKHQKKAARSWTAPDEGFTDHGIYNSFDLMQAYRLYTLALAGAPELGAMNRMRERDNLSVQARWRLAAAYALAGKPEVAKDLVKNATTQIKPYRELSNSFGSATRDRAMITETMVLMDNTSKAMEMVRSLSENLSSGNWYSTQTTAYALLAIGKFVGDNSSDDNLNFAYNLAQKGKVNSGSALPIAQVEVPIDLMSEKTLVLENTSQKPLYARLIMEGQPLVGDSTSGASKLSMTVRFKSMEGEPIYPTRIPQGTDFIAEITIKNPGEFGNYNEMALSNIFPSGWEIHNSRMDNIEGYSNTTVPEYQDIRDDRVYTYFDIRANKQQTYRVQLNAAYQGRFYMPTTYCEAMYDNTINARIPGQWVEVVGSDAL